MIGISAQKKDEMLAAFSQHLFRIALFDGDEEIVDAMYSRQDVQMTSPLGEGEVRWVENAHIVRFEGFNAPHLIDHWGIVDESNNLVARYKLTGDPQPVSPSMDCKFRPGELRIGLP